MLKQNKKWIVGAVLTVITTLPVSRWLTNETFPFRE